MVNYIDHHQWLVNNNMLTDQIKDNIAMGGYCLVEGVKDVGTSIDFNDKLVHYKIIVPDNLYNNLMLLKKFNSGESLGFFESIRLKKFLKIKKENDESGLGYNLENIGNKFVKTYLNKEWSVKVDLIKESSNEAKNFWLHSDTDKSLD
jgi:hypothetical protein